MEIKDLIQNWRKAQMAGAVLPCPRCGKNILSTPSKNALSRQADVYVCDRCGTEEAVEVLYYTKHPEAKAGALKSWFLATSILGEPKVLRKDSQSYKVSVNREVSLTNQDIDDIMCAALEGGINYWCASAEIREEDYLGEYAHEQISRGGSLSLYDAEDDMTYTLTLDDFLRGFALACKNGYGDTGEWIIDNKVDACNIDAEAADIIVQYALFGDIVYG